MNRSRLTLIIDGNWLMMSRLSVLIGKSINEQTILHDLNRLMIRSINLVLKTFPSVDNVIFVADGGSWRNTIEVPKFLKDEGIEYKGNRIHSNEEINMDLVFETYNSFIDSLEKNNINVYKEKCVEGDDWIMYWTKRLNSEGTNCIIWSKDKDLSQLVRRYDNGVFTCMWNKENGIYSQYDKTDDDDFLLKSFNMEISSNDEIFDSVSSKQQINVISPNDVVIDKIIRGDKSDNIMPIIVKQNTGSSRQYKVSQKMIDYNMDIYDESSVREYINRLCQSKQYKGHLNGKTEDMIYEHFAYNRKLVALDYCNFPEEIKQKMENYINSKEFHINRNISMVEQFITAKDNGLTDILDEI